MTSLPLLAGRTVALPLGALVGLWCVVVTFPGQIHWFLLFLRGIQILIKHYNFKPLLNPELHKHVNMLAIKPKHDTDIVVKSPRKPVRHGEYGVPELG